MKIAILDLGTNTFNILIRETDNDEILLSDKIAVKLGSGGIDKGYIVEDAFERGINAMSKHYQACMNNGVSRIRAIATSAIRDASNGKEFTDKIKELTGIEVEVIDGIVEAKLILGGVAEAIELPKEINLIMDIGGGSTEFILAHGAEAVWMKSYQLGVSRLLENYRPSDPMTGEEMNLIVQHLDEELQDLKEKCLELKPRLMIGSSGSFDTLSDICQFKLDQDIRIEETPSYLFDLSVYRMVEREIFRSTFEQRLQMKGMVPMRADMMVLSCLLIQWVHKHCGIQQMWGSRYALKEGVYMEVHDSI